MTQTAPPHPRSELKDVSDVGAQDAVPNGHVYMRKLSTCQSRGEDHRELSLPPPRSLTELCAGLPHFVQVSPESHHFVDMEHSRSEPQLHGLTLWKWAGIACSEVLHAPWCCGRGMQPTHIGGLRGQDPC